MLEPSFIVLYRLDAQPQPLKPKPGSAGSRAYDLGLLELRVETSAAPKLIRSVHSFTGSNVVQTAVLKNS